MKWGEQWPRGCELSSLRLLGSVGEPINPEAWVWYHEHIGRGRCPVVDTWWQTETGAIMITTMPGISVMKPGSAGKPLPGIDAEILNEEGQVIPHGGGFLSITSPWPSMLRGIWGDQERYVSTYWGKWQGKSYFAGDGTKRDEDGYFWFLGLRDPSLHTQRTCGVQELKILYLNFLSLLIGFKSERQRIPFNFTETILINHAHPR